MSGEAVESRLGRYGGRLLDAILLGVPLALIERANASLTGSLFAQPWRILWIVAPLAVATWLLWRQVIKHQALQVRGPMLLFLIGYLSIFTLAASSDLLAWRRSTVTFEEGLRPRAWLLPAGWGDWHYWLAKRVHEDRLVVITMDTVPSTALAGAQRVDFATLIQLARHDGAAGIAFDYFFEDASPLDPILCGAVDAARAESIPVIGGQRLKQDSSGGPPYPGMYPAGLEVCFPPAHRGLLHAYADADNVVRQIVLRALVRDSAAFSLIVATQFPGSHTFAEGTLLQFVEPRDGLWVIPYSELARLSTERLHSLFYRHFILVGQRSPRETIPTPFGDRLGVVIHAAAISSLLNDNWIRRPVWWSSLLVMVVACYVVAGVVLSESSKARMWIVVAGLSVALFAGAALAMWVWQVWLDIIYPMVAMWLLFALLLTLRKRLAHGAATTV